MLQRQSPAHRRAVIHDVHCVTLHPELVEQSVDELAEAIEGVGEPGAIRHVALAVARIIRRDDAVTIRKRRDQIAEHVRRRRKAVQEQHDRRLRGPGFAIKDVHAVDLGGAVMRDGRGLRDRRAAL
jgi:hypothetical protein